MGVYLQTFNDVYSCVNFIDWTLLTYYNFMHPNNIQNPKIKLKNSPTITRPDTQTSAQTAVFRSEHSENQESNNELMRAFCNQCCKVERK